MKFSVLLPTCNRLELLKTALYSVVNQDFEDWEIIISDNFSEEDVLAYVLSLNDSRIKYFRTEKFVPVTDNWNNALEKSSGDYVIMLGDDDCLLKGYFKTISTLLKDFHEPDFIYTSGFQYAYPGVLAWCPDGLLTAFGNASFLEHKHEPFWLPKSEAFKLVKASMNFKVMFAYNMQYAVISRKFIEKLICKGNFFQTSYPDYYAMTALMLKAERILACPVPLVAVGISPKSFGFYYFNQKEEEGGLFLNNSGVTEGQNEVCQMELPGTKMNTFWLFSMQALKNNFSDEFTLGVNYNRYRFLQVFKVYKNFATDQSLGKTQLKKLWSCMHWKEMLGFGVFLHLISMMLFAFPKILRRKIVNRLETLTRSHPSFASKKIEGNFLSLKDVFEEIDPLAYEQKTR